jgi:hypothetical protein
MEIGNRQLLQGGIMKEESGYKVFSDRFGPQMGVSRREFIRTAAVGMAGAALAGSHLACSADSHPLRKGLGNMFMEGDKPLLVIVEGTELNQMLEAGLDAMGGLDRLVTEKNIVLKPNIVSPQPPPVTTDVELVVAVAERAREAGARSVTACDACASGVTTADKFKGLGYPPRLEEAGIGLDAVDFSALCATCRSGK